MPLTVTASWEYNTPDSLPRSKAIAAVPAIQPAASFPPWRCLKHHIGLYCVIPLSGRERH